jgi:hypothetical protein
MKFIKYIIAGTIVVSSLSSFAQNNNTDAFRFSGGNNSSTARFDAMGGQQTSIGGDLTSLYGNPAGLGMFTKSEFSFTPSYNINTNKSSFLGSNNNQTSANVNLNNIGVVFHSQVAKADNLTQGVLSFNFGLGYQKTNFFRNDINFGGGVTNLTGLGDYFAEAANGENATFDKLGSNVNYGAYDGYLISDMPSGSTNYVSNTDVNTNQNLKLNSQGSQSNMDFSMGINISNKVYLGTTLGLASINYLATGLLNEQSNFYNTSKSYNANLINNYGIKGSGVNVKFGGIFKPVYEFRIGLSVETPTWYRISDDFSQELSLKNFKDKAVDQVDNYNTIDYNLSTPLKLNGGLSYFIGKSGFLTANLNYVDYSGIRYKAVGSNKDVSNSANNLKGVVNYSIGAEFKVVDNLTIRAGYTGFGNPYRNVDYKAENYSGGLGYRFGNYYLDGAVVFRNNNGVNQYSSYAFKAGDEPISNVNTQSTNISLTFGARF